MKKEKQNHKPEVEIKREFDSAQGVNHLGDGKATRLMHDKLPSGSPSGEKPLSEKRLFMRKYVKRGKVGFYYPEEDVAQALKRLKRKVIENMDFWKRERWKDLHMAILTEINKIFGEELTNG